MTVSNTTSTAQFPGTGTLAPLPIPFRFFKDSDLVVLKRSVAGTTTALMLNVDYSVTGAGSLTGGTVTPTSAAQVGELITVARVLTVQQLTDLRNQGDYFAEIHEDVFDYLTMLIQQVNEGDSRALKHPRDSEHYEAEARRIVDLEDPVDTQDAATKGFTQTYVANVLAGLSGPINNASNIFILGADGLPHTVQDVAGANGGDVIGYQGGPLSRTIGRVVRPEQFPVSGPVGAGSATADTAGFVAAASALRPGDTLYANGSYLINGSAINFSGLSDVIFDLNGARFAQQTNLSKTLQFTNCRRIKIIGGNFVGRGGASGEYVPAATSYNGVAGIFLSACDDVEIFGSRLFSHAGGSIVWRESDNLNIHHNLVVGIGPTYIPALGNGQDFAIGGFSDDITRMDFVANISHNTISDTAFGIFHNRCKSLLIEGNTITRIPGQHGIYVIECSGLVISNNLISNCVQQGAKLQIEYYTGRGIAPAGFADVQGVVVTGNAIRNCQDGFAVISTSLSDGTNQKVYGVEVTGNSFFNMTGDGVNLNHCIEAMVASNNIRSAARFGINFKNCSGVVADNSVVTSGSSGLSASLFHGTEIRDNRLVNCGLSNGAGAGNDVSILVGAPVNPLPDANVSPIVLLRGNHIRYTGADSTAAYLMDFGPTYQVHVEGTRTGSLLVVRVQGSLIFCERNDFLSFENGAQNSPATFLPGAGRRDFHGQVNPQAAGSTKAFFRGDRCWNTNTTASGPMGWVCITSGSPGVWKAMAVLAA